MTHALPPARGPDAPAAVLPWIKVAVDAPYFVTETGLSWTPIGQNDSIGWVDLQGLYRRRDVAAVETYLNDLREHGVTCMRLMLEHSQVRHRYFERPVGRFVPNMVAFWDDLFVLCERAGMRILLTPFDTFWAWIHWRHHPFNSRNGGVVEKPSLWLSDRCFRAAIKHRLAFAVRRWGGSGALFAWDLWNEIHPSHGGDNTDGFDDFIADLSHHVRSLEIELYGRSHPQTVSVFGPALTGKLNEGMGESIFRHPALDFATIHIYEKGTIDHPRSTIASALAMGRIVRESVVAIEDKRPFFDTEHGPIHAFNDLKITLPESFDDEYFRYMQWAHLASGGVGGGMRWPYRHPHRLTEGMRNAQRGLARFCALIDWSHFDRQSLNVKVKYGKRVEVFACGDTRQAILWCLRKDTLGRDGRSRRDVQAIAPRLTLTGFQATKYHVRYFDTLNGITVSRTEIESAEDGILVLEVPEYLTDIAVAIT